MHEPPPQEAFTDQTSLLHHTRGADVLHVAYSADAEDRRLAQGPIHNFREDFCHEAPAPPGSRQSVTAIKTVWCGLAQGKSTAHVTVGPVGEEDIGSRDIWGCSHALSDVGLGIAAAPV